MVTTKELNILGRETCQKFFSFTPKTSNECQQKQRDAGHLKDDVLVYANAPKSKQREAGHLKDGVSVYANAPITMQQDAGRLEDGAVSVYANAPGACSVRYWSERTQSTDDKRPMESMYANASGGLASVVYANARDSASWPEENRSVVAQIATVENVTDDSTGSQSKDMSQMELMYANASGRLPSHAEEHEDSVSCVEMNQCKDRIEYENIDGRGAETPREQSDVLMDAGRPEVQPKNSPSALHDGSTTTDAATSSPATHSSATSSTTSPLQPSKHEDSSKDKE